MAMTEVQIVNLEGAAGKQQSSAQLRIQRPVVWITIALFIAGFIFLAQTVSLTQALLYVVAGVLGIGLYHARYGFTTSYRNFIVSGRGVGIRAQMIMFLIANILFLPFLLRGSAFGHPVAGYVFPVGISVLVGSILFGVGMQMGDACASGSLYHAGGGDIRGVLTLIGFVIGSVLGTINFTWWMATPQFKPVSFIQSFGAIGGLLFNALLLAIVFVLTLVVEKGRTGGVESMRLKASFSARNILRGPWSWIGGSIVLAIGNLLVLLLSGKPWGVTSAFALWGAKVASAVGVPVTHWGYWQAPANALALHSNVFRDVTTILNIGIIFGSLLAAGLAGRFPKTYFRRFPTRMIVGVLIGGMLMGYGARIAFGCNIGAYFAGIASFSLHGWEWMIGGMIGSAVGVLIRPLMGLSNR